MAPCSWSIDTDCCPGWSGYSAGLQADATAWATYILWAATGRQYGLCSVTVRPCWRRQELRSYDTYEVLGDSAGEGGSWVPYMRDGAWTNCGCGGPCCCGASCEVPLPGPVAAVTEVRVNNVIVNPASYRVDNRSLLVRQDGECWPECQDFDQPASSATNTFVVVYQRGTAVPTAGQVAAGRLACEYAKLCSGGDCVLPERVRSLTRQGVSMELVAAEDEFTQGRTGISQVDLFIAMANPGKLRQRPRVLTPDLPEPRMTL